MLLERHKRFVLSCAIFAAGFLAAFLPLLLHPTISFPDEIYQSMEPGHRLVFGYGIVPWEFAYAARSWLIGYLAAGPMKLAQLMGAGPEVYLALIWAMFSLLAAAATVCAFLWGRRAYGAAGGVAVALVSAFWIDNLYFGGRATSEVVGAHLLIIAAFLAEPGYKMENARRLALAGALAGAGVVLRIQLAPAAALLWFWGGWNARRFIVLSLGAAMAVALDGAFDALTWHYPFEPLWRNIQFNLLQNGAANFGTAPVWFYLSEMSAYWGGTVPVFLGLALLGGRRMKLLLAMAVVILAVHSVIAHKEYRFIVSALSMLAGFGLVELARLIARGWQDGGRQKAGVAVSAALAVCWAAVCLINLAGHDYKELWDRGYRLNQASLHVAKLPRLCGVGFADWALGQTGGYTYLHRRVGMYAGGSGPHWKDFLAERPDYNVLVRTGDPVNFPDPAVFADYKPDRCFGEVCVYIRPGGCADKLPPKSPHIPMSIPVVDLYPIVDGVP